MKKRKTKRDEKMLENRGMPEMGRTEISGIRVIRRGIDIRIEPDMCIVVGGRRYEPQVRRLGEMKDVLYDRSFAESADPNMPLYFMYRDVSASDEDAQVMRKRGIRYDITIIPPKTLGSEFVKTMGHYHPPVPSAPHISYPEIYEVQSGKAHFLLQKIERRVRQREKQANLSGSDASVKGEAGDARNSEKVREQGGEIQTEERITDVVVIFAEEGDKVVIPPNYGHVTINPADETLCMANFVARDFSSIYESYLIKRGAAYFELTDGSFVKNERYGELPEIRILNARDALNSLNAMLNAPVSIPDAPLYALLNEKVLDFLTHPEKFFSV